jgi:hypothetical protein
MAGQIINRGEKTWLVRVYLGCGADGKRQYQTILSGEPRKILKFG